MGTISKIKVQGVEHDIKDASAYNKPSGGIPKTDLASSVQDSLGLADSAIQDISGKVDKVEGKGLSTNDYTNEEKNKLAGIAAGAQVNVIETIKIAGTTQTVTSKTVDLNVFTKDEIADPENYLAYGIE